MKIANAFFLYYEIVQSISEKPVFYAPKSVEPNFELELE